MIRCLLFLFGLFLGIPSFSQTTPKEMASTFFDVYKGGDTDKSIDYLFTMSPYAKDIQESLDNIKRQLKKTVNQSGKFQGADLLTTKSAGVNLVMLTYLVRHDREPLVFNLLFYRPAVKWQLQNFKYSNSIDDELEEASKAYRLKENFE